MKRNALIAVVALAVAIIPFGLWWYRTERNAAA